MVNRARTGALTLSLVGVTIAAGGAAAQRRPDPYPNVIDAAEIFDRETRRQLTDIIETINRETRAQLAVATAGDLAGQPLAESARRLYMERGLGLRGVDNGALILIAPAARDVHLEVGRGLRRVLNDAVVAAIVTGEMQPLVADERFEEAAMRGARAVSDVLLARYALSPEEERRLEELGRDPGFYVVLVMLGALAGLSGLIAGVNARNKTAAAMLAGVLIGILLMLFCLVLLPLSAAALVPMFVALAVLGFRRNYATFNFRRDRHGRRVFNPTTWEVGAPVFFRPTRSPSEDDGGR